MGVSELKEKMDELSGKGEQSNEQNSRDLERKEDLVDSEEQEKSTTKEK